MNTDRDRQEERCSREKGTQTETDRRRGVGEKREHRQRQSGGEVQERERNTDRDRQEERCSRGKGTQRQTGGEV